MKNIIIEKNFSALSKKLRSEFDQNFSDPRLAQPKRFVWDYWYLKNHYHHLRTPAYHYFSSKLYSQFHSEIVQWGRRNLGCHDISPPWLSYYVDGCYQNMHSDVPHGPWAFVYSLTVDPKKFLGGETFILKPEILNYWKNFSDLETRESDSFFDVIPSRFNQLTVFDPRYPHGVTELKGTRDPQVGRLVIHGWFVEPRPYVVGSLKTSQVQKQISEAIVVLSEAIEKSCVLHGAISFRLSISSNGEIRNYKKLTDTLVMIDGPSENLSFIKKLIQKIFMNIRFPKSSASSEVTIPLLFR